MMINLFNLMFDFIFEKDPLKTSYFLSLSLSDSLIIIKFLLFIVFFRQPMEEFHFKFFISLMEIRLLDRNPLNLILIL